MKKLKLFLTALSLISATSYAKEMIVEPIESSKEVVAEPVAVEEVIETPSVIETKTTPTPAYTPLYNVYGKIGVDVWSKYDEWKYENAKANKKETKDLGFEVALEATKNLTDSFELGLGVAYQNHSKPKSNKKTYNNFETAKSEMPKYDSVPLYAMAKYNFNTDTSWKPYLKATLGYSINFEDGDAKETYTYNSLTESYKYKTDVKNGLYYGVGAGVEYENFFVDLMYQVNEAKAKITHEENGINYGSKKNDFDYSRVTLGFGYKFTY